MSIGVSDELLIGRAAEGAGKLADDEEISRSHARITVDSSGFCAIEDLGSTNGTFVNGLRITAPETLSEGDTIEIGESTLVVREVPKQATEQAAEHHSPPPPVQATVVPGTPVLEPMATQPLEPADVPEPPGDEEPPGGEQPLEGEPGPVGEPMSEPPAGEDAPAPVAAPIPPLSLRLQVNIEAREVTLSIEEDSGTWRTTGEYP
jgi:predicted component of type VI protein secretion system